MKLEPIEFTNYIPSQLGTDCAYLGLVSYRHWSNTGGSWHIEISPSSSDTYYPRQTVFVTLQRCVNSLGDIGIAINGEFIGFHSTEKGYSVVSVSFKGYKVTF